MKLTINTDTLIKNIQLAFNTIDTQGLNPILSCILFDIKQNQITITTSNNLGYSQINIKAGFKVESTGKFLIKGKIFLEILSTIKSKEINLEIIDDSILRIYYDNFLCNLNTFEVNSYPSISFQYTDWINFKLSNNFIQQISKLSNFTTISSDIPNPLSGICLDTINDDNLIKAVATNSYHLGYYQEEGKYPKFKIIITQKILDFLNFLVTKDKESPILWTKDGKLIIEYKDNLFFFKLLDMDYPSVYKTLESNYIHNFEVKKTLFMDMVNRTLPLIQNIKDVPFFLKISENKLSFSTKSIEFGESFEEIKLEKENFSQTFNFKLNVRYLNHVLKVIDNDLITFNFIDINKAILITDKKDKNWKFLILPQRQ